jgi:hypothetical protein
VSVVIMSLCGLSAVKAVEDAATLLDIDSGGPDRLDRLLVLDDTALLVDHLDAYQRIDTMNRVEKMVCVAVGPRPGDGRKLELPGSSLGGVQGAPVLWLSRPAGVNWKATKSLVANRHPGFTPTTVDRHPLVELLSVEEMFDRVYQTFLNSVPGRVASPGLWLAGGDDEAATFAGAAAAAIRRICDPGPGLSGPYAELMPGRTGGARLAEAGPLDRYRGRVAELDRAVMHAMERRGGLLRRGDGDLQGHVAKVGEALADLRDLVDQVLRDANVDGGTGNPTPNQLSLVRNAGLEFGGEMTPRTATGTATSAADQSPIYRVVAGAIRGGDPIPSVGERLIATEREVERRGSAEYRQEVEARCPSAYIESLTVGSRKPPRRGGTAEARRELRLDEAVKSAGDLTELIVSVANREWSPGAVTTGDLVRAKAALDGTSNGLTRFASETHGGRDGTRAARLARLGESLAPVLHDLILCVVAAELASPSASGPEARRVAKDKACALLEEWAALVQAQGVTAQPSFASEATREGSYSIEDDADTVREALLYPPRDEMWQLCAPADLSTLDVDAPTLSVRFASRLTRSALRSLPGDEPVWMSSGSFAGLLRLVPLRAGITVQRWGEEDPGDPTTALES